MGAYTCEFGVVHKVCRCPVPHTIKCDKADEHGPAPRQQYEYVVWDNLDNCIHRGPMSEREAVDWLEECREAFPEGAKIDKLWSVRRRPVGEWETYD